LLYCFPVVTNLIKKYLLKCRRNVFRSHCRTYEVWWWWFTHTSASLFSGTAGLSNRSFIWWSYITS
jgi:hypothetical protein